MSVRPWSTFYEGRVFSERYLTYAAKKYDPFIGAIRSRRKVGDKVVEVGCGIATITKIVSSDRPTFYAGYRCFDLSPDMVELAEANLHPMDYPVQVADARLPIAQFYPDIIHSHGMLEHFSDDDIKRVIEAGALSGARWGIHYVPGNKYKSPSFGDERLLPIEFWAVTFNPTEAFAFNEGHDYCLIWRY